MVGKGDKHQGRLLTLLLTTAFTVSVLFLFGPIQMYIANLTELWFPITDVLWPTLAAFILAWAVVFAVGFLLRRWEKIFYFYLSLIWGLGAALYIQGNFIPFTYGILNGETIDWGAHRSAMLLNALLWVILLGLPFVVHVFLSKYFDSIIRYSSCGLIFVQLIAVVLLCVTTDFSQTAVSESYLSDEGLYEVSDEQNVIIFILDSFDQNYFQEIYEEDPNFVDFLDGFTYFENATGIYPNTKPAIAYLLTGQYYENRQPYSEYVADAWKKSSDYYQELKDNEFDIDIYTTMDAAVSDEAKEEWIDNAVRGQLKVSSRVGLEKSILQFTAMRFFPDAAKKCVWSYDDLFEEFKSAKDEDNEPFVWDDIIFYQGLLSEGLCLKQEKQYKFIHLSGVHPPYSVLEDVSEETDSKPASGITQARACLNIMREYIQQLKDLGVYDQTSIVITADHGLNCAFANPILLVKNFGNQNGLNFSNAPVSHADLRATITGELNLNYIDELNHSVFSIDQNSSALRRYLLYTWSAVSEAAFLPDMTEYHILPDGNDSNCYILTGTRYTATGVEESEPYLYQVGDILNFDNSKSLSHFLSGITQFVETDADSPYVWSIGYDARALFYFKEETENLTGHIYLHPYVQAGSQRVIISSQGVMLYDNVVTSDMPYINFSIPKKCIQNGLLMLDFQYPDACSSTSLGSTSGDLRLLSIGFVQLIFTEQKETEKIDFSKEGNGGDYFYSGWHGLEDTWSWTNETADIQVILPSDQPQEMLVNYWTHPGANDTKVYYNGEYVGTLPHHDETEQGKVETITLPTEYKSDSDAQLITFTTDGATTSKEYYGGDVTDSRVLGIAVSKIQFRYPCALDEPIAFDSREAAAYFRSGAESYAESSSDGENLVWTMGTRSQACFPISADNQDLTCRIRLYDWMPTGAQTLTIVSQGRTLFSGVAAADMTDIEFTIPKSCWENGQVVLDFEHPDACSPKSLGISEDDRPLALGFQEILFTGG